MNDSITFVPICPICHHVFNHIDVGMGFNIVCPECGAIINTIKYPNFDKLYKLDVNGEQRFVYDVLNHY